VITVNITENISAKIESIENDLARGRLMTNIKEIADTIYKDRVWATEGALTGEKWASLKPSTVRDKSKKGFGSKPILQRTGRMKASTRVQRSLNRVSITNTSPYFQYHQQGTSKMVARPPLRVNDQVEKTIENVVVAYINSILR
jgi:phage gpG-like protein